MMIVSLNNSTNGCH